MAVVDPAPVIIALTEAGLALARRIAAGLPHAEVHSLRARAGQADVVFDDVKVHLQALFEHNRALVGVCAAGVLIRVLAPLIGDKHGEPPVLAVAEDGSAVVPLLGGHRGGNALAERIAAGLGIAAAITSASDRRFGVALDAPPRGWRLANPQHYKSVVAALLAGAEIRLVGEADWLRQSGLPLCATGALTLRVTEQIKVGDPTELVYHPAVLAVGVGCERGVAAAEVLDLVRTTLAQYNLAEGAVAGVFSLDVKMDEAALHTLAADLNVPLRFFAAATLEQETPRLVHPSKRVFREVGCHGVAEAAALAAVGVCGELVVAKTKSRRATCAVARAPGVIDANEIGLARGSLAIVGIGPGAPRWRAPHAEHAIQAATDVVGYRLYLDLLGALVKGKTCHEYPLGEEELRARMALELAAAGKAVALVCSGDPGIYALATLVFELLDRARNPQWARIAIEVVPGISALQAAAALSGAPLGHDFCAISLSDLLTPWEAIERRLRAAAAGDFVVSLYNPVSRRRTWQLQRAVEIFLAARPAATPVVLGRNLGREGERIAILRLDELHPAQVDMLTVVLIGSSATRALGKWVYTPRGYAVKHP